MHDGLTAIDIDSDNCSATHCTFGISIFSISSDILAIMFEASKPSAATAVERTAPPATTPVPAPLTASQLAIVKSTAPILKAKGEEITTLFYKNMIGAYPELHNIFNQTGQTTGAQPRALAGAVFAYASHVDDLGRLRAVVERIAHKHVSLVVQPEQYEIVGKYLIEAVATVLGDAVTAEVAEAWTAAYGALADVFINREKDIYAAHDNWDGWRTFKIQRKVEETAQITSFYLIPEDGKALPPFQPGQYISLRLFVPEFAYMQPRQYSLSDAPQSGYYRISVKKDSGKATTLPGWISNALHDKYKEGDNVELTHPTGDFFVSMGSSETAPIVLISAGVGVTPMMSILNSAVSTGSRRPIAWIQGSHSAALQPFGKHVQEICAKHNNVKTSIFTTISVPGHAEHPEYFEGHVDLGKVGRDRLFLDNDDAEYYTCGPLLFMNNIQKYLASNGVDPSRIHMEVFGVGDGE
jgi:nitric oxide dioxygenase